MAGPNPTTEKTIWGIEKDLGLYSRSPLMRTWHKSPPMHGQGDLLVFWKQRWEGLPWRTEMAHNVLCKRMGDRNPEITSGLAALCRPPQPFWRYSYHLSFRAPWRDQGLLAYSIKRIHRSPWLTLDLLKIQRWQRVIKAMVIAFVKKKKTIKKEENQVEVGLTSSLLIFWINFLHQCWEHRTAILHHVLGELSAQLIN